MTPAEGEVKLVGTDGRESENYGELWVRNPGVTPGYHNLPAVNRQRLVDVSAPNLDEPLRQAGVEVGDRVAVGGIVERSLQFGARLIRLTKLGVSLGQGAADESRAERCAGAMLPAAAIVTVVTSIVTRIEMAST